MNIAFVWKITREYKEPVNLELIDKTDTKKLIDNQKYHFLLKLENLRNIKYFQFLLEIFFCPNFLMQVFVY